ncbi:unnamed protein product [Closterium sp. NIES-53]
MTEYWVSQGQHWCEYCRIFLANNAASIRMHEGGTKHKEAVAAKLSAIPLLHSAPPPLHPPPLPLPLTSTG